MSEELFNQAIQLAQEFKDEEALVILQNLIKVGEEEYKYEAQNMQTTILFNLKRYDECLLAIDACLANTLCEIKEPLILTRANIYFIQKDDRAMETFKIVAEKKYKLAECHYYLGTILMEKKDYENALSSFKLSHDNKDFKDENNEDFQELVSLLINMGYINKVLKNYDEAFKRFDEAMQVPQTNNEDKNKLAERKAKIFDLIGQIHVAKNEPEKSIQVFEQALSASTTYLDALIHLTQVLKGQQRNDEALQRIESFQIDPSSVGFKDLMNQKGLIYYNKGDYTKAIECFIQVTVMDNQNYQSYNNLALSYKHINKLDEALVSLNQAIQLKQNDTDFLVNKGNILDEKNDFDGALQAYNQAILLNDQDASKSQASKADAYNNKGITLKNKKDLVGSIECFNSAINHNNNYILAYTNKAQVELQLGNGAQALVDLHKAQTLITNQDAIKDLSGELLHYIKQSLTKVIELESKFEKEAESLEEAFKQMKIDASQSSEVVSDEKRALMENYQQLKEQKIEVTNTQLGNIQSGKIADTEDKDQIILAALRQLTEKYQQLIKEQELLKQKNEVMTKQIEDQKQRLDQIDDVLQKAGAKQSAEIVEGWNSLVEYPDLYDYTKAFYWTLLNLIDTYRVANTGAFAKNVKHTEVKNEKIAKSVGGAVLKIGAKIAESIPFVGSIFTLLEDAMNAIYSAVLNQHYNERVKSICAIVMLNKSADAQTAEQQSKQIALAALAIAERKREILGNLRKEADNPPPLGWFAKNMEYIEEKVNSLKAKFLGKDVDVYESVGAKEALKDVMILIVYMQSNYEKIIEESADKSLAFIIADAVIMKKTLTLLNQMDIDKITQNKEAQAQNVKQNEEKTNQVEKMVEPQEGQSQNKLKNNENQNDNQSGKIHPEPQIQQQQQKPVEDQKKTVEDNKTKNAESGCCLIM